MLRASSDFNFPRKAEDLLTHIDWTSWIGSEF